MRDHSHHIELSRQKATSQMLEALAAGGFGQRVPTEQVDLAASVGRVLAEDVTAKTDVPNALTCCMDSVAVHWAAFADLPEGELPDVSTWTEGVDWTFANTGVAMPEGFDTAIVVEHATFSEDGRLLAIDAAPSAQFAGTKPAGETMGAGDVAVAAGTLITAEVAASIASAGRSVACVLARPRVAFLPTGNELVPPNVPYAEGSRIPFAGRGRTYESNSFMVRGKVEAWGGAYVPFDIVADDYEAIKETLLKAAQVADVIVLNAGSSKGSDDWSVEVLEEIGQVICHQTNHGPGHHSSYAVLTVGERLVPVVGISGPPGGAAFTLNFYLRPVMRAYLGLDPAPELIPARLAASFGPNKFGPGSKVAERAAKQGEARPPEATGPDAEFYSVRCMLLEAAEDGTLQATPVPGRPGTPATAKANALYMLAAGPGDVFPEPGEIIHVELR